MLFDNLRNRNKQTKINGIRKELAHIKEKMAKEKDPCHVTLQRLFANSGFRTILNKNSEIRNEFLALCNDSAEHMAATLIGHDKQLYDKLDLYEFTRDIEKSPIPTLKKYFDYFNQVSYFVSHDILSRVSLDERTAAMEYWISVAHRCISNPVVKDINMMMSILGALNISATSRLSLTFQGLSKAAQRQLKEITRLGEPTDNNKGMRKFITNNASAIPYLGYISRDFIHIRDGNEKHITPLRGGAQSFEKNYYILSQLIRNQSKCREVEYTSSTSSNVIDAISKVKYLEKEWYDTSLKLEPRSNPNKTQSSDTLKEHDKKGLYGSSSSSRRVAPKITSHPSLSMQEQMIILDKRSIGFLPHLRALGFANIGLITDGVDQIPQDISYTISRKDHKKELQRVTDRARHYYKNNLLELYSLVEYGRVPEDPKEMIQNKKVNERLTLMKQNQMEFENYFKKLVSGIKNNWLVERLLEDRNNQHPNQKIEKDHAILFHRYARDLLENKRFHLLHNSDLIGEPPLRKALAIAYRMQYNPSLFSTNVKSADSAIRHRNNIALAKEHFSQLEGSDLAAFIKFLKMPSKTKNHRVDPALKSYLQDLATKDPDKVQMITAESAILTDLENSRKKQERKNSNADQRRYQALGSIIDKLKLMPLNEKHAYLSTLLQGSHLNTNDDPIVASLQKLHDIYGSYLNHKKKVAILRTGFEPNAKVGDAAEYKMRLFDRFSKSSNAPVTFETKVQRRRTIL